MLNSTTSDPANEEMNHWYMAVATLVASVLSLAGGLLIIYGLLIQTFCCRCHQSSKSRENPTITTLIFSMTVSDIFQSVAFIAGAGATLATSTEWMSGAPAFCETQGFLLQVFAFATPMWVLAICITLHRLVVNAKEGGFMYIVVVSLVCWGVSLLLGVIPFSFDRVAHGGWAGYGPTGAWCWIHSSSETSNTTEFTSVAIEQWALFYIELLLIFFTVVGFSIHMVLHIHRQYTKSQMWGHWKKRQGVVIRRLLLFPFAFIVAWSGGITNHVWELFNPTQVSFALGMFHACTVCSQGWLNAIAYGATNQKLMCAIWKHMLRTCCCCCRHSSGAARSKAATMRLHSRLSNFVDDSDSEDETGFGGHSELSRNSSAEMVTPIRTPSQSVDIGHHGDPSDLPEHDGQRKANRTSTQSTSSLPAGTSPYSLLHM